MLEVIPHQPKISADAIVTSLSLCCSTMKPRGLQYSLSRGAGEPGGKSIDWVESKWRDVSDAAGCFVSVPQKTLLLAVAGLSDAVYGPLLKRLVDASGKALDERYLLCLSLLIERCKGCESTWAPYLDVLPLSAGELPITSGRICVWLVKPFQASISTIADMPSTQSDAFSVWSPFHSLQCVHSQTGLHAKPPFPLSPGLYLLKLQSIC